MTGADLTLRPPLAAAPRRRHVVRGSTVALLAVLVAREREVLGLLPRGLTNAAIAQRLHLSDKTVRNHVSSVFSKLHVSDRAAAVARARDAGYGAPSA